MKFKINFYELTSEKRDYMNSVSKYIKKIIIFIVPILVPHYSCSFIEIATSTTRIVAVRDVVDSFGNSVIQVTIGASGTNPNTWVSSTISGSLSATNNYNPRIFSNSAGDFIVLWGYLDPITGNPELACASLLNFSIVWHVVNVSQSLGAVELNNYVAAFDNTTNVVIGWSATIANNLNAFVATLDLNTNTWTPPFMIPN